MDTKELLAYVCGSLIYIIFCIYLISITTAIICTVLYFNKKKDQDIYDTKGCCQVLSIRIDQKRCCSECCYEDTCVVCNCHDCYDILEYVDIYDDCYNNSKHINLGYISIIHSEYNSHVNDAHYIGYKDKCYYNSSDLTDVTWNVDTIGIEYLLMLIFWIITLGCCIMTICGLLIILILIGNIK